VFFFLANSLRVMNLFSNEKKHRGRTLKNKNNSARSPWGQGQRSGSVPSNPYNTRKKEKKRNFTIIYVLSN
jgi:hypothetical protein